MIETEIQVIFPDNARRAAVCTEDLREEGYHTEAGKLELLKQIAAGIAAQFGSDCEVVVHDLSRHPDRCIVAIENGHVTGRKVGDGASRVVLEQMEHQVGMDASDDTAKPEGEKPYGSEL